MSLQAKALQLKLDGAIAIRHGLFWEKQIQTYGIAKATAFYTSLGLNHLQVKGFEWEGLTLSREPTEAEKLCVKGIAGAQETAKEKITAILLKLRTRLISDGLEGIQVLEPATYHQLTLSTPTEIRADLRDRLIRTYHHGRDLVASELGKKEAVPKDEFELLDDLVDTTDSRVINDVQSRITAAAARYRLLGLGGSALWKAVEDEIRLGSVSYIDRAAIELGNKVIGLGRFDEMRSRDDIGRFQYSAILDQNTCASCASEDGKEASSPDDLEEAPNPSCDGGGMCRCFIIAIAEGNM